MIAEHVMSHVASVLQEDPIALRFKHLRKDERVCNEREKFYIRKLYVL